MVRSPSGPERRAYDLLARAGLSLRRNDGTIRPVRFFFDAKERGTSVIEEDDLYRDGAGAGPKSFHSVTPDFLGEDFAFEIKGSVSGEEWDELSRDARNDHFRFALLRVRFGAVTDRRLEFASLAAKEQRIVTQAREPWPQAAPESRLYVRWDDVKSVVVS